MLKGRLPNKQVDPYVKVAVLLINEMVVKSLVKNILGKKKDPFVLRYCKSLNEWELVYDSTIVYIGSKENCERYKHHIAI